MWTCAGKKIQQSMTLFHRTPFLVVHHPLPSDPLLGGSSEKIVLDPFVPYTAEICGFDSSSNKI
jgi:hypothetical protein